MLTGEPEPTGPARPPRREAARLPVTAIDSPALPEVPAELAAARADETDRTPSTAMSVADQAIGREQCQGWIARDPTIGIERRPAPPDRTKALAENQIAALWRLDIALREKSQCWPTPSPHPTTSRTWTAEHSIGSATAP